MSGAILELRHLDKHFGALHVTRDVSLTLLPGEVHALIGPNGAGKTTLISQIAGQLAPDSGQVWLAGEDITALGVHQRARRGLARVFQISRIIENASVLANVLLILAGRERGLWRHWRPAMSDPALLRQAHAALAEVGLEARSETPAGDLAYGERRALELGMALAQTPRVLLLDEPMAGVGREEGHALTQRLLALKGRIPMLLIEHDMATVFALADRVSVLIGGGLAITGTPDEVRADPAVRQAYLGEDALA